MKLRLKWIRLLKILMKTILHKINFCELWFHFIMTFTGKNAKNANAINIDELLRNDYRKEMLWKVYSSKLFFTWFHYYHFWRVKMLMSLFTLARILPHRGRGNLFCVEWNFSLLWFVIFCGSLVQFLFDRIIYYNDEL